jgi:hypothetical protein
MALTAKFVADFSSFYEATQKAEVSLKGFESQANKVNGAVNRMADQFSGRKLIQEATLMAAAIEKIGGASNLTEKELQQVAQKASDAVAKMRLIGETVPPGVQNLANQLKPIPSQFDSLKSSVVAAGSALGLTFGAGAILNGVKALVRETLNYADTLSNLSASTSISVEGLQRLEAIGVTSSVSMESMAGAVETLQKRLSDPKAVAAVKDLGLNYKEIRALAPEEQFLKIAAAVSKVEDPVEKARLGAALFKGMWNTIAPAMKNDIDQILRETNRLTAGQIAAADKAGDTWDKFYYNFKQGAKGWLSSVLEMQQASDGFEKIAGKVEFTGGRPGMLPLPVSPFAGVKGAGPVIPEMEPSEIANLRIYGDTLSETATKADAAMKKEAAAATQRAEAIARSNEQIRISTVTLGASAVTASQNVAGFNIRQAEAVTINRDFSTQLTQSTIHADAFGHVLLSNVAPSLQGLGDATHQAGLRQKETIGFTDKLNTTLGGMERILSGIQEQWAQAAVVGVRATDEISKALAKGDWVGAIVAATAALVPFIAKLFGASEESKKVSPMRDEFFKLQGGLETLNPKVQALEGNLSAVQAVFDAKTVQQYDAAMKNLEAILAREQSTFDGLTDAAEDYAVALKKIPTKIPIQVDYRTTGDAPSGAGAKVPGFAGGTDGRFLDFGAGSLVMLHGKEAVVPEGAAGPAGPAGVAVPGGGDVVIHTHLTLDGREIAIAVQRVQQADYTARNKVRAA